MPTEIALISSTSGSGSEEAVDMGAAGNADPNDVRAFENALHDDPFADGIMAKVDSVSGSLAETKVEFEKSLKLAAETSDPTHILESMRMLSEYTLQTSMVAKAAGKTSQAVDKLTNLS